MELITGHAGENHISSDDDAAKYAALFGANNYILDNSSNFDYTIESNNLITLIGGELVFQGRHARTKPSERERCVIENGSQGTIRHDLIGVMYKNSGGVESAQISVIKGTAGETGADPTYPKGNIEGGSTSYFVPIYRVVLNGLNIESVQKIIETRYRIPNFLPVGTSEPDSNLGENGDVYFQIVIE